MWWLGNGVGDFNHPTEIYLDASPATAPCVWSIVAGADKVTMVPAGCQVSLLSRRFSLDPNDVKIQVSVNGVVSAFHSVTVRTPFRCDSRGIGGPFSTQPRPPEGWLTRVAYELHSCASW